KRLVGELLLGAADVAYVQAVAGEEDEYVFELITETETDRIVAYYFVLSHAYEPQDHPGSGRAVPQLRYSPGPCAAPASRLAPKLTGFRNQCSTRSARAASATRSSPE